jgi:hypothetical protein
LQVRFMFFLLNVIKCWNYCVTNFFSMSRIVYLWSNMVRTRVQYDVPPVQYGVPLVQSGAPLVKDCCKKLAAINILQTVLDPFLSKIKIKT